MRVHNLLLDRQRRLFVGRAAVLNDLQHWLEAPEWQLLNIHGPGGIGKSTLLRLFAERVGRERVLLIDGNLGLRRPADFLVRVRQELERQGSRLDGLAASDPAVLADAVNVYAEDQGGLLLLCDAFEKWAPIEDWFRERWLPELHPRVRCCLAGRSPLEGEWMGGGWNLLVRNLPLLPLTPEEIASYAHACQIADERVIEDLKRLTRGVPLALSMACDLIRTKGSVTALTSQQEHEVVRLLMAEIQSDIRDSAVETLLDGVTVVRRFDQELLEEILQEPVAAAHFRALCRLPFVSRHEGYWMLHDAVRQWAQTDFQTRKPVECERYRARALQALQRRAEKDPANRPDWQFDQLYLSANPLVRGLWFQGGEDYQPRRCRPQDLPRFEELYASCLHLLPGYVPGDSHMGPLIRPLWQAAPESFWGLWDGDRLIAVTVILPLRADTAAILADHPFTAPIAQRFRPGEPQYWCGICACDPAEGEQIFGSLARGIIRIMPSEGTVFVQMPVRLWQEFLDLIGYERAPWADVVTPGGTTYLGYQSPGGGGEPAPEGELPPVKAVAEWLRPALKYFDRLHLHPKRVEPFRGILAGWSGLSADALVFRFQDQVRNTLAAWAEGTEEEQLAARILQCAYVKRVGSHNTVADRLHLSLPTYYRHLRLSVHRLAQEFLALARKPA